MAEHSRTLHYDRESQTSGVRLYTTQGAVTSPTVITDANTESAGTLYTTAADDTTPALRLKDGSTTVYAKLEEASGTEEGLMASDNEKNYVAPSTVQAGIALIASGGGAGTWGRVGAIDFSNTYPWNAIETVTIDGQTMVKIPKFYVKYGEIQSGSYAGKKARWVSETKKTGYHIYPAFVKNGKVMDCFYIGAYEAYNAGSNTAGSAANQTPWVNLGGFENAKTYCTNRGDGWHLQNIYERSAISLLFLLEYGTTDAQAAIGAGNSNSSAAVSTGSSNAVYRGMHELWGNVREQVDGIKGDGSGNILIWDNKGNHTYVNTGKKPGGTHGQFILDTLSDAGTDFDFGDVFIPGSTAAAGSATYPDIYYGLANDFALVVSGGWRDDMGCGLFLFGVGSSLSGSGVDRGLRIAKDSTLTDEVA